MKAKVSDCCAVHTFFICPNFKVLKQNLDIVAGVAQISTFEVHITLTGTPTYLIVSFFFRHVGINPRYVEWLQFHAYIGEMLVLGVGVSLPSKIHNQMCAPWIYSFCCWSDNENSWTAMILAFSFSMALNSWAAALSQLRQRTLRVHVLKSSSLKWFTCGCHHQKLGLSAEALLNSSLKFIFSCGLFPTLHTTAGEFAFSL